MNLLKVMEIWKKTYKNIAFESIDVEKEDIDIPAVPTIKLSGGKQEKVYIGNNTHLITKMLEEFNDSNDSVPTDKDDPYNENVLKELVNTAPVMIFIKGTPTQPKCKFTRQLLEILNSLHVRYSYFDILSNEYIRHHLKEYAEWSTFPQIYLLGEFLGGLDIIKEMVENNELQSVLKDYMSESIEQKCNRLVNQQKVMLFIKGTPEEPRCGFSKTLVSLFNEHDIQFGYFDILQDEDVRQTLKELQDWPTYPMVFVRGELQGGLDIVKEMLSGELQSIIDDE